MNAFIEIIETLVKNIAPQTWLEQRYFPFPHLESPQAILYDACFFEANAQGAYGFLWLEFDNLTRLFVLPFRLARYQEDADLISIFPWSLREATSDALFYEAWRRAQKHRNPLITWKGGHFSYKKMGGETCFVPVNVWSDSRSTCMRLDFQVAYKMFRVLDLQHPLMGEVELLSYLGTQTVFQHFAKLMSVFEYSHASLPKSHIAVSMRYVQNNGSLFPYFVSLLHKVRFPKKLQERACEEAWSELLRVVENLGRLLGDFHHAMCLAPRSFDVAPEQTVGESKARWIEIVFGVIHDRLSQVLALAPFFPQFSRLFSVLPNFIENLKEKILHAEDLGLRIRIHGHIHLGQFLMAHDDLVLIDYESDNFETLEYRKVKQPCVKDLACILGSLKYAWYFSERNYYEEMGLSHSPSALSFHDVLFKKSPPMVSTTKFVADLRTLEQTFLKSYRSSLMESSLASQLYPADPDLSQDLYRFCFTMRLLKEVIREPHEGNPRPRIWLQILQEFVLQTV